MRGRWQAKDGVQFMLRIFGHVAHVPEGLQQSADLLVTRSCRIFAFRHQSSVSISEFRSFAALIVAAHQLKKRPARLKFRYCSQQRRTSARIQNGTQEPQQTQ